MRKAVPYKRQAVFYKRQAVLIRDKLYFIRDKLSLMFEQLMLDQIVLSTKSHVLYILSFWYHFILYSYVTLYSLIHSVHSSLLLLMLLTFPVTNSAITLEQHTDLRLLLKKNSFYLDVTSIHFCDANNSECIWSCPVLYSRVDNS